MIISVVWGKKRIESIDASLLLVYTKSHTILKFQTSKWFRAFRQMHLFTQCNLSAPLRPTCSLDRNYYCKHTDVRMLRKKKKCT